MRLVPALGTALHSGPTSATGALASLRAPGWGSLRHLVLGRMLVASLALPSGLLLRPDVTERP
ncbi:MAG: hypothetical protein ABL977_12170, partial [Candidatus Eisenbacteria bacterium]